MIFCSENNHSKNKFKIILVIITCIFIYNLLKKELDEHRYIVLLENLEYYMTLPLIMYILRRSNIFLISQEPNKYTLNTDPNNKIKK